VVITDQKKTTRSSVGRTDWVGLGGPALVGVSEGADSLAREPLG
jgi:hypothetical protein